MKIKKFIIIGIVALVLSLPTVAFAYSYAFTVVFTHQKSGLHTFELYPRNNFIYIDVTSRSYGGKPTDEVFYVDVIKQETFGGKRVLTFAFLRDGSSQKKSGYVSDNSLDTYYLKFRKAEDGETVDAYGRIYDMYYK